MRFQHHWPNFPPLNPSNRWHSASVHPLGLALLRANTFRQYQLGEWYRLQEFNAVDHNSVGIMHAVVVDGQIPSLDPCLPLLKTSLAKVPMRRFRRDSAMRPGVCVCQDADTDMNFRDKEP